ncbi:hypothetical protein STIUS_v1c05520 [Spiroplasma sp. TIUS-1]|uniref:ABC transporter permease n=1 Tax=Spiroplasma sp. TIUS-1 TaxID=216963 RepID=UPI0013994D20|nr:ABC transporter permease [Spiroplasma sp. TIUS-1]QHX36106.1 hypothetical protein STIUS_v1c05520 [Spiroplasma sp. TIUS-1]
MKSFKLLFKNGFKQLFQFKFSLLAILILAMIGSLVISTSVSTMKKLNHEFNKVVNSQEKFSNVYENTTEVGLGEDFGYLPFLDLVSKEQSTSAFINFSGEVQSNINLNLVDDSFIGKYFTSEQFKKIFPFLLTLYSTERRGNHFTMIPHTTINNYFTPDLSGINNQDFKNQYGEYVKKWIPKNIDDLSFKLQSSENTLTVDSDKSTWYSYATDIFFNFYVDYLSSSSDVELRKTLIGEYTLANKSWFKSFESNTWIKNLELNESNPHFEMYKYVHFSLSTLISQVMFMSDEFYSLFKAKNDNFNWYENMPVYTYAYIFGNASKYEDKDEVYKEGNKVVGENNVIYDHDWEKYIADPYERFNFTELVNFKSVYEGSDPNKEPSFENIKDMKNLVPAFDIKPDGEFKNNDFKNILLYNGGYRGVLNPVVAINRNESIAESVPTIIAKNDFKSLTGITDGVYKNKLQLNVTQSQLLSAFYQSDESTERAAGIYGIDFESLFEQINSDSAQFQPISHWKYNVHENVYNNPLNYYYKMHLKMAAKSANMDLTVRDELIYSDILAGKKYRLITMDSLEKTNFELIEGTKPLSRGEVAVSSQYAKYNNVRVGDLLKIGKSNLAVSGIAVDAYSFFPIVDATVPIPKPRTSGIMYLQKETLNEIFKNDLTQIDMSSYKQSIYLFAKSDEQRNEFLYKANLSKNNSYQNYLNFGNSDQITPMNLKSFDNSTEALNWKVFELFSEIFFWSISGIVLVIMVAIALMLFLVIKKSIQMNLEKIAILISIGYKPIEISVSYVWYAIIITAISVPLGWIVGTVLQLPIERLFQDFFTIDAKKIAISAEAFIITFALMGIVIGLFLTMLIAWKKMSKPYIELMNENKVPNTSKIFNFLKKKVFGTKGFKRRFAFDVAAGASKSLFLMSMLIVVSSLMISNLVFIPSVALTTKSKYNENVKYKNEFKFNDPITNDPLASRNINYWAGVSDNINNMIDINYEIGKSKDTRIINNYNGYKSISSNSSFMPHLLYSSTNNSGDKKQFIRTTYEDMVNDPSEMLSILLGSFMYNLHNNNGKALSIGMFDQLITETLNENSGLSMKAKAKTADRLTKIIGGSLPTILKMVNFPNMEFNDGDDWKESLLRSFTTKAPSYIKEYIGVKERQSAINFGFNTVNVVPGKDSLGTELKLNSDNGTLNVVGVDRNQSAFEIPYNSFDKIYGSDQEINEIYKYLNGETNTAPKNNQYFDSSTNTLTIPMIINQSEKIVNKIKVGNEINNINVNTNKYVINTPKGEKDFVVPNAAWKYDDTDFFLSDYYRNNFKNESINTDLQKLYTTDSNNKIRHYYKNAFAIDQNKISYKNQYTHVVVGNKDDFYESLDPYAVEFIGDDFDTRRDYEANIENVKLKEKTYMFGDFVYEQNGQTEVKASYVRPYYNYRNFKLFIPVSSIVGKDYDKNSLEYKADLSKFVLNNGLLSTNNNSLVNSGWIDDKNNPTTSVKTVSKEEVPTDTLDAYKAAGKEESELADWVVIRPYDIDPLTERRGHEQYLSKVSQEGTGQYWLKNMLDRADKDVMGMSSQPVSSSNQTNKNVKDLKVKLRVVGVMDTYNGVGMITNSDLLNLLISVENNKQTVFDHSRLDKYQEVGTDEGIRLYDKKDFNVFNTKDWWKDAYIYTSGTEANRKNQVNNSIVNRYSNSIYSNVLEPLQITTGVSMQTAGNSATYALHDDLNTYGTSIVETKLLAEQKEVIDQLFKIAMFIALIFITIILIIVIIVILISSDIYLSKLRTFIVSLKAFGYSKREIWGLVFGVSFGLVIFATIFGFLLSWATVSIVIAFIIKLGMAVPFVVSPLVPLITFLLLVPLWAIGSLIISNKILLLKPVDGFKQS